MLKLLNILFKILSTFVCFPPSNAFIGENPTISDVLNLQSSYQRPMTFVEICIAYQL